MEQPFRFEAESFETNPEIWNETWELNPEFFEEVWQGEMNRNSPEFVKGVQDSLNKVMGLRLAVDGVMGPMTRSAIRSFQQKKGLVADGIVGPKTEAALTDVRKTPLQPGLGCPTPNPSDCTRSASETIRSKDREDSKEGKVRNIKKTSEQMDIVLEDFDIDDHRLKPNHQQALCKLIKFMSEDLKQRKMSGQRWTVSIDAGASHTGTAGHNKQLSISRANCIEGYMRWHFNTYISTWDQEKFFSSIDFNKNFKGFEGSPPNIEKGKYRAARVVAHRPGKVPPPLVRESRIEFLGPDMHVLRTGNEGVHFGLFDNAVVRDPSPPQWPTSQDPLLNDVDDRNNFVGADSRRFYIRLTSPLPQDIKSLPNGTRIIQVEWYTSYPTGQVLDDNNGDRTIALVEKEPGIFVSRGLMLVTTEEDRDCITHCGIPELYLASPRRKYGESDHRTRLGGMFSRVHARYTPSGQSTYRIEVSAPVFPSHEQKRLQLQIFVLTDNNGAPAANPHSILNAALRKARTIYERLGIFPQTVEHPYAEKLAASGSHPEARKVRGGLDGKDFAYLVPSPGNINAFSQADERRICETFQRTGNIIRVFVVQKLASGSMGESFPDADHNAPLHGSTFIPPDIDSKRALLAHEVGHLLTNKSVSYGTAAYFAVSGSERKPYFCNSGGGHFTRPGTAINGQFNNRFVNFYNLMGGTRFRLWDVTVTENPHECKPNNGNYLNLIPNNSPPNTPRHFNQYRDIRNSAFVLNIARPPSKREQHQDMANVGQRRMSMEQPQAGIL